MVLKKEMHKSKKKKAKLLKMHDSRPFLNLKMEVFCKEIGLQSKMIGAMPHDIYQLHRGENKEPLIF